MTNYNSISDNSFLIKNALENKTNGDLGIDLRGINNLSKDDKIKQISIQFEQMFVKTLLKDVFKDEKKESGFGMGADTLNDFRLNLFSQHITESGGLGYQEIIEQQIREKYFNNEEKEQENSSEKTKIDANFIKEYRAISGSSFGEDLNKLKSIGNMFGNLKKQKIDLSLSKRTNPVEGRVSSDFGWRKDPFNNKERFHSGIDIAIPKNTPVKSFMDGEVVFAGWKKGYGNFIEIKHSDGYVSKYGHNEKLLVKKGDKVKSGNTICLSGSSGRSTGPHLHFEVSKNNKAIDPAKILP